MAESQKGDSSSVNMKEKKSLLDLDIGNDFLSSWKSMSMAEGEMDFDLTPVSKGNKKSFEFDKADMGFDLDVDFGKMPSFKLDMADLDISPEVKKDGKSKESKELSSGKDKRKNDRFAIAFDFDDLDNFNFESSLAKEDSKARRDKNNKESSLSGNACQNKEGSMDMNPVGSMSTLEEGPRKPYLPDTVITFDMDRLVGRNADLEPIKKSCLSNLAMDDAVTSEHSAVIDEVASDKTKIPLEATIASGELTEVGQSKNLVSPNTVDLEACTGTDAVQDLSSDPLSNNEPTGGNSSETHAKVDFIDTNASGSNGGQDVNMITNAGSTFNYEHRMSENPKHPQTVAISEKNNGEKSQVGFEDHVIDNTERTKLGQVNSLVENSSATSAESKVLLDTTPSGENQEHALETLRLPLVSEFSQSADQLEKETDNTREPVVTRSRYFIRTEKPECPVQKAPAQTTFSSLSSKKMGLTQPSLVEGRRDQDSVQSDKKLVSLPLKDSKTLLRRELPQIWIQESFKDLKICREVCSTDGLRNGNKLNDPSTTEKKDMVETRSALRQSEPRMKYLDTLSSCTAFPCSSMEISKEAARNSGNPKTLASTPTIKIAALEKHKISLIECGRKTPDLHGLKLSGLNLDSTESPVGKDLKSVGNNGRKRVLSGKTPSAVACIRDSQKKTPTIPMKRKSLEDDGADIIALHPSKHLFQSSTTSRNFAEASEKILDKKVPSHNIKANDHIKSTVSNSHVSTFHIPHDMKIKDVKMSFSIQNDNNIKQAESYSKELDHLCNMLRKRHDEAKEILVQAIVNNNKLLMLHNPLFDEKIRATQESFSRLTLNRIQG